MILCEHPWLAFLGFAVGGAVAYLWGFRNGWAKMWSTTAEILQKGRGE